MCTAFIHLVVECVDRTVTSSQSFTAFSAEIGCKMEQNRRINLLLKTLQDVSSTWNENAFETFHSPCFKLFKLFLVTQCEKFLCDTFSAAVTMLQEQ